MKACRNVACVLANYNRFPISRRLQNSAAALVAATITASPTLATTYYVSPTGNDTASGTTPAAPWASAAKVDATAFKPGDQVLFQYGSTWDESLSASSSGTAAAPIVYGAYGNSSLGNPVFSGSSPINASAFTLVSGTTYAYHSSVPVNSFYTYNGPDAESQNYLIQTGAGNPSNPAANLSVVENNPYTFYYNQGNGQLYINLNVPLTNQPLALGLRQDAIYNNNQSNLIFRNLNTTETMADNAGYGIRIIEGSNVTVLNSNVSQSGKHGVGVIDSTGVTVTNVTVDTSQPLLGFGGASAFVSYGDSVDGKLSLYDSSVWTNDTYNNPNGPYAVFISHGGANGVASMALNNMTSVSQYDAGTSIYTTGPSEAVTISGGRFNGSTGVETNNSIINGVNFQGPYADVALSGSHSVVQNSVFNGGFSDVSASNFGAYYDLGTGNTFRFNVVNVWGATSAITSGNSQSNTNIYGNIVVNYVNSSLPIAVGLYGFSNGLLNSNYNLFASGTHFMSGDPSATLTAAQWQSMGYDLNSLFANALFNNSSADDYSLQSNSPGMGLVPASALDYSLTTANSLLGPTYSNGNYSAGLNSLISTSLNLIATNVLASSSTVMTVISPNSHALTIKPSGSLTLLSTASMDLDCSVLNSGSFVSTGSLIETGNFYNSGFAYFLGSQLWSPGSIFNNIAGNAVFGTDTGGLIAPIGYLSINASGGSVILASSQHLAGLSVLSGATLQVAQQSSGVRSVVSTPTLTVTGILDITNNDLVIQGGNLAQVTAMVRQGFNSGNWNGSGITSSLAESDISHLTSIGVILNNSDGFNPLYGIAGLFASLLGNFDGFTPNYNDVLMKYTYVGDANLDGKVDGSDYSLIDNGLRQRLTGWYNGDFNYDGTVNGSDYTLIDNAFNDQGTSLATAISTTQIAANAVPEPMSSAALIAGLVWLSRRRR